MADTRTPQDYALEHAEYLAAGVERLLDAVNDYGFAVDVESTDEAIAAASQALTEARCATRVLVYEFRKRRDRAASTVPQSGWISVDERLPEWASRDDTPCFINGKEVPPTLFSETVLVALNGGGVRTDKLTTIEGKSDGWWHTFGERVIAWQPAPPPPSTKGEPA